MGFNSGFKGLNTLNLWPINRRLFVQGSRGFTATLPKFTFIILLRTLSCAASQPSTRSSAGRFLGLCVRIPPRPGNVASVVSCEMQVFTTNPFPVLESPTDCVCMCTCVFFYRVRSGATVTLCTEK